MNNLRQIRKTIYALKRQIGVPVKILTSTSLTQDVKTGEIVNIEEPISIRRAVVTTAEELRKFSYDLSYIAANKNFTYGGFYDTTQRILIIDFKDLPATYEPSLNDNCIYEKQRYRFTAVEPTAGKVGLLISIQRESNTPTEDVIVPIVQPQTIVTEDKPWLQ